MMLAVILEFDVIDGMETDFREAWAETTKLIHQHFGSLGSRLHKPHDNKFIAYAQWPSYAAYDHSIAVPKALEIARYKMRSTLKTGKPIILYKLEVDIDLLK